MEYAIVAKRISLDRKDVFFFTKDKNCFQGEQFKDVQRFAEQTVLSLCMVIRPFCLQSFQEPRAKPAKKLVASLLRKQPMECDLEHLKFQKINDSPIYWNSPVQAKKKEVAGRISWQSSLGDAGYEVDLGIQFDDEAFKGQGYKRKPGQDEAGRTQALAGLVSLVLQLLDVQVPCPVARLLSSWQMKASIQLPMVVLEVLSQILLSFAHT